ncbi:MAG: hypothetical protein QGH37_10905 [Candidatus Poribacteria bacterium]|nr:hypothetical protein [Candidatus Poribacteria bacterium]MDP6996593.1 hypothetical protein [Candidatus Poribacteria bacterium]
MDYLPPPAGILIRYRIFNPGLGHRLAVWQRFRPMPTRVPKTIDTVWIDMWNGDVNVALEVRRRSQEDVWLKMVADRFQVAQN